MILLSIVLEVLTSVERTEKIIIKEQKKSHFSQMVIVCNTDTQKNI